MPDEVLEAVPEGEVPPSESVDGSPPAAAPGTTTRATGTLTDRQVPVLTFGVGLAMVGLGIGFLGVRMRRR
ncbi:hypothetical protein ACF06X_32435 [Streptomyces sp. NPDC015346]|uniref:hypothetical protein n=1 Tax=Streptomyces sp. NPDC015346 TaxID=3364954 RepID=UPI0037022F5C